ncbi:tRNA epoxyqueuosine(34) reductase QueG [Alicyclobacillus sp. ALC3]|uniref:tRNA epoxyqueuosine(34) reductase QueG n=1 Tax=Alicyclobacillus sp. ALC3 TaxID=2796143 RepID=UPI0023786D49|nr:tRNA epoxyqueuosine(34) reductase QueG [Alicyclobacillus sp. ALC3]WDL98662.1 tRNA epoxyqueuosine(34) reductase QueG [Alicyclobacillus sp. ALC3]
MTRSPVPWLDRSAVVALGRSLGFDAVGVTSADPFPELEPRLAQYADRGRTGFEWHADKQRIDPRAWMPEAKSLIAVALAYLTPAGRDLARRHPRRDTRAGEHTAYGQTSVYTYGVDYHSVMHERLRAFAAALEEFVGHKITAQVAVDTSPLVDRRVAERAGIGWVGKNCMFFTPPYGSYVFLGTLGVDINIPPNALEQTAACGTCSLCLDACPTGALLGPGVIDATRCLSYVTQMKGIIPRDLRKALGRRVFGCDTCQWVCPQNHRSESASHAEFTPVMELAYPDLIAILALSNRQFERMYGHTAGAWRGLRTWQRNALIALGNCKDAAAVPHILPFLQSPRPELRASAAWALAQIDSEDCRVAVAHAITQEVDESVREDMQASTEFNQSNGSKGPQ